MTLIENIIIGLSVSVFILFICFYSFFKIRQRLPKQQICWFCHKSQEVSYDRINSFDCIYCHQYNGFLEDGSYNKVIGSQFQAKSHVQYCQPIRDSYSKSVQLCSQCNVRQEIKMKLLAEFVPFNEMNFTQECHEYKKYLEKEYKLCSFCETTLKTVLSQPINSNRDVINKNNNHQKVSPNTESVFVGHNSRRNPNWFSFSVINIFETISLFCALILFVFGLDELQNETELSIIEFPVNWIQYLESYVSNQTVVVFSGFITSMTAIIISGKQSLLMTNIFSQFLWIALISSETSLMMIYIERIDSMLLRPILSLFVVFFSIINTSLRLFALFNIKSEVKQKSIKTKEQNKCFENSTNNKLNVCSEEKQVKSFSETNVNPNRTTDQLIGEKIKSLSILDETDSTLNYTQTQHYLRAQNNLFSNNSLNSSLMSETSSGKSIILPAKFHYQSVAQTSWASPFKPNTSPRKENLNFSSYITSSQSFARTSHWVSHHISGLVTPPPSATASVCSDSALVNRFASMDGNNCLSSHMYESRGNDLYNSNNHLMRSRFISHQFYSRDSNSKDSNSESSLQSRVTRVNGSLYSLNNNKTSNHCPKHEMNAKQSLFVSLTQNIVFALFLLILFCFVIFLSLPIVLKTSCDLNSMKFHLTIESLPQIDVCIK